MTEILSLAEIQTRYAGEWVLIGDDWEWHRILCTSHY
jgi:hypothetical protein